jgi:hypothetical protein
LRQKTLASKHNWQNSSRATQQFSSLTANRNPAATSKKANSLSNAAYLIVMEYQNMETLTNWNN